MPDLTATLLPDIQSHRLPGFDLGDDFIYPRYEGQSILNIPASLCHWLDAPPIGVNAPLRPEILLFPQGKIERVVLILLDALALHRFQEWVADGLAPVWKQLTNNGLLAPLTSITPSTTSAATTTLWTGVSPATHGIVGYEVWLKQYGVVANMILHSPITFRGHVGDLAKAGFDPEEYLTTPTLGTHLQAHGVSAHAFMHRGIARSGLSRMHMNAVDIHTFNTPADLWISVRQLLEAKPRRRLYTWVYWGAVDGLSHHYQPDDERTAAEFSQFSAAFEKYFLNRLPAAERKRTLVILTADHGQIYTPDQPKYLLTRHPKLDDMLHIRPTGENRLMFLYPKAGQLSAVRAYIEATWPGDFACFTPEEALQSELFGPGPHHRDLRNRMGDLIVAARGAAYLWWGGEENPLRGRHGGLHPQEMLVPFLGAQL